MSILIINFTIYINKTLLTFHVHELVLNFKVKILTWLNKLSLKRVQFLVLPQVKRRWRNYKKYKKKIGSWRQMQIADEELSFSFLCKNYKLYMWWPQKQNFEFNSAVVSGLNMIIQPTESFIQMNLFLLCESKSLWAFLSHLIVIVVSRILREISKNCVIFEWINTKHKTQNLNFHIKNYCVIKILYKFSSNFHYFFNAINVHILVWKYFH